MCICRIMHTVNIVTSLSSCVIVSDSNCFHGTYCILWPFEHQGSLAHDSVFGDEISHKSSSQNSGAENYCTFDEILYSFVF